MTREFSLARIYNIIVELGVKKLQFVIRWRTNSPENVKTTVMNISIDFLRVLVPAECGGILYPRVCGKNLVSKSANEIRVYLILYSVKCATSRIYG